MMPPRPSCTWCIFSFSNPGWNIITLFVGDGCTCNSSFVHLHWSYISALGITGTLS
jgi:hypothetical protein